MDARINDKIRESRMVLQNPYAYLDDSGGFDAVIPDEQKNVHEARRVLRNQYAYLDENGGFSEYPGTDDAAPSREPLILINKLNPEKRDGKRYSRSAIERIARTLQKEMWGIRKDLLPARAEVSPMEILDPALALASLGYETSLQESLGQYSGNGELYEVAGIINNDKGEVQFSRRFSPVIRNFTAAHELGHAVLHGGTGLHRDRALDGSHANRSRDPKEAEADIFAAYFLLPEKQVIPAFKRIFLEAPFALNEDTSFALAAASLDSLQMRFRTLRDLSRFLASSERYNGVQVVSLANRFNVSTEAMAIRLEELDLVQI